ncbi:MAG: MerR family transcriptional regulator [Myxococcota bacterium]
MESQEKITLPLVKDDEDHAYLKVGELARRTGKTVRAIHLHEEMGLLKPAARSAGGFRLYREEAIKRVEWISKLQEMGFTLHEIQSFLRSYEESRSAPEAMTRVRDIFEAKLQETQAYIVRMGQLVGDLRASLGYLESCHHCGVHHLPECAGCERFGHDGTAPILVAGLRRN